MTDPAPILDLIDGFRRSKTMFAAVSLGIFDGKRPKGAAVDRLLDACTALGLLDKRGGEYVNTPLADTYLRQSSPSTLSGYIRYSNAALYRLWGNLEDAAIEGTNRWKQTFGDADSIYSDKCRTAGTSREFVLGMHGTGMLSSSAVAAAFDLSPFNYFVDLGGATGHLALAVKDRYPGLRVGLFDLAEVIELAKEIVGDRVELLAGDFTKDELPRADVFALGRILHNQNELKSRWLLARVYAALKPGGAILLAERLIDEDRRGPVAAHMNSLNMLVCADGRERSLNQYTAILRQAGFKNIRGIITGATLDAILATK